MKPLSLLTVCLLTIVDWRERSNNAVASAVDFDGELLDQDSIPHGAASLAFVFDVTGSMYDDLVQVIEGAAKILATTLARREKPLYNYILVPFHDPEVGPVTVTTDPEKFQDDLRDLYVQGGGDCPEMSITAIKMALQSSLPNSFIYVFTDARAKDYSLTEQVLTLIQHKQSQVVFVMTGDCGDTSHPGYKAYEQIAATSSGQIFLLKKSQVNQVLNFVRVAVQSRKVNLVSMDRTFTDDVLVYKLPVDTKLQEFTISVSGERPRVVITDPSGVVLDSSNGLNTLLSLRNAIILNIKDPKPGNWTLRISAQGQHTIRITGLSSLDFVHGFTSRSTLRLSETEARPRKGTPTFLLINATDLDFPGRINKLELVNLHGNVLVEIPVQYHASRPWLYNVSSFLPPQDFFYLKVVGIDSQGYDFQRTTPTAISPIDPELPSVQMPVQTDGFFEESVVLTCAVTSLVPFAVQWSRDDQALGNKLFYSESTNVTWSIPAASSSSEGLYTCNATNGAGWAAATTNLQVKDPPPTIVKPLDVYVMPGRDAILTCVAHSTVDYNVTWFRQNPTSSQPLPLGPRGETFGNGSAAIRKVERDDEGKFICRASNEGGHSDEVVNLIVHKEPKVSISHPVQKFIIGSRVDIYCSAIAYPKPVFSWRRKQQSLVISDRVSYDTEGHLIIVEASHDDVGEWECVAKNPLGVGSATASLETIELPSIHIPSRNVLVNSGDTAQLICVADGIPQPNVTWKRGGIELQELSFIQITPFGELSILGTQEVDGGEYECVASNEAGSTSEILILEVGSAPVFIKQPQNKGVDILKNVTLPCSASGKPAPNVTWSRTDGKPIDFESGRIHVLDTGAIFIQSIQKEEEGMYTCTVSNQFGKQDASAFIAITGIVKPLIAYTTPSVETYEGRDVKLTCVVLLGNPPPKILWFKMGEQVRSSDRVTDDGNGNLQLKKVKLEDEGEYTCVASNPGGNASHSTKLDVQVPPSIEESETEILVARGRSARLPCEVRGDPKPQISWAKNGVRISEVDPHYFISESGSLEIFNADPQDTATYSCTAINAAGVKEKRITLFVQIPPQMNNDHDEYTVIVNNPIQLGCEVTGIPPPDIGWKKSAEDIDYDASDNLLLLPNGALRINHVKVEDGGLYECTATSTAGVASKTVTLNVQVPPRIDSKAPPTMVALAGEEVLLPCEVTGDPRPEVEWRKDLARIDFFNTEHKFLTKETGSLVIPRVSVKDTARYLCVAENPAGVITQEINLIVHEPPKIPVDTPTDIDIIEDNRVTLPCPASGTPTPRVRWFKEGVPVTGDEIGVRILGDGSLQLDHVQAASAGSYNCLAENVAGNVTHHIDLVVYLPPRIDGANSDDLVESLSVIQNHTLRLPCPATAIPPPQITWYKSGEEVVVVVEDDSDRRVRILDDGLELEISGAEVGDAARYTCVARNLAGEVEKLFDVDVFVIPKIDEETVTELNVSIIVDRPLSINCPASGNPPPVITWYKDGIEIAAGYNPGIRILSNGRRLEISNADVSDKGRYMCVAKNPAGSIDRQYILNVWIPAKIDTSDIISDPEVTVNQTITLHCPASGDPLPVVGWYRDGAPVDEQSANVKILDNGWRLHIKSAEVSHAARYTCRAKNVAGDAEKNYDLSVLVVPKIDTTDVVLYPKVIVNRTVILNCPVSGIPAPGIVWTKNGDVLDPVLHPNMQILAEGKQLRIGSAAISDSGAYLCIARNKAGEDSLEHQLSVFIPTSIDRSRLDYYPTIIVNQSKTLECPVIGIPTPKITWFKDGDLFPVDGQANVRSLQEGRKLEILSAQVVDTGSYECRAENEAGKDQISYDLKVYVPPTINVKLSTASNPQVVVGKSVVIRCHAEGVSAPRIEWLFGGQPLGAGGRRHRLLSNGQQLEILDSEVSDTGRYSCVAKNEAGIADRDFDLDVLVPPSIDDTNLDLKPTVIKGRVVTLSCPVQGIPFPNITWLKGRDPVELSHRARLLLSGRQLEISLAEETDTSVYTCVATNVAGDARKEFQLSVLVPPAIDEANLVDSPKIIANRTVLLECPVAGIPPPKVKWQRNGEPFLPQPGLQLVSHGRHLEILKAKVTDTARYTCIATNDAGELRRNFDLEVLVPAHIVGEGTVEEVEVIENHTTYLVCQADGIPPPSILWLKDNVPLLDIPYANIRELSNGKQLEMRNVQRGDDGLYRCQATNVAGQKARIFKLKVLVPPRIQGSRSVADLSVIVRQSIRMECDPSGTPEPEITWFKDGEVVGTEQTAVRVLRAGRILQVTAAEVQDAGVYTCNAQNIAGQEQRRYNLRVQVPPTIDDSHVVEELSAVVGSTAEMLCPAHGTPEPVVRWLRDGQNFTFVSHPNLRILDDGVRLQVLNTQLLDHGGYTCVASNVAGQLSKEYTLNVLVPPTIEEGPTEVAATVSSRTVLLCETLGLPKPEVSWEKNSKIIPLSGPGYMTHRAGSLQFSSVQVGDSGSYRCIAKNAAGTVHRDISLTVQVPPKIEHKGQMQLKVVLGSSIDLPCRSTGVPKPRITWQKGTRILADVPGFRLLEDGSLRIESPDLKDAGIFVCVAQNNAGTALGQVRVEVEVPPSIEAPQPEYRAVQRQEIVLPCRASGVPNPRVHWEKDGQPIKPNDLRYRVMRSGWLTIPLARVEDAGTFTCIAENDAGKTSADMKVTVHVPPSISDSERFLTVSEGEEARLPCVADGHPPPMISWIQDGRSVLSTGGRYLIHETGTLIIGNIQATDSGNYVCTAKNSAGRDSREVVLKVEVPPTFTLSPRDQEVMVNGRIELECQAEGIPTPVISWKINNTDFQTIRQTMRKNRIYKVTRSVNGRSKLIIEDAMKRDDGTYMCVAENSQGARRTLAAVRVKVAPKVLLRTGNQAVTFSERVLLHCPVDGADPPPTIVWMKNNRRMDISDRIQQLQNGSLAIYDSSNADAGEYKCIATNEAGSSEGFAYLTVRVPPTFKVEPPQTLTIDGGSTVVLNCVAEAEPAPEMVWKKERRNLQTEDRLTIMPNNSLRITGSQLADSGVYICMARNNLGSILVSANLTVKVHGQYSVWSAWSECSVSCDDGTRSRTRACSSPAPANGGRPCSGPSQDTRPCTPQRCSVDGGWTEWTDWEPCSHSCGSGFKSRTRDCVNPVPQYGGRKCSGESVEKVQCNVRPCPVDGGWGDWSPWRPCSETCGEGTQDRYRRCDSPHPKNGGRDCGGVDTDRRSCKETDCEVNGGWGSWSAWTSCSLSCGGGGTRHRRRMCDSPPPSRQGRFCPGSEHQSDSCNKEDCPVNGHWTEWSSWGRCTTTCGGGQRQRIRSCSNPLSKSNGRQCAGSDQESGACNNHGCTDNLSHRAVANVIGNINNHEFGIAKIYANVSRTETGTRTNGKFVDIPGHIGRHLQPLVPILTPISWTTATEVDGAANGQTLTQGHFDREVQVSFATGEVLNMTHSAKGVDSSGVLNVDVILSGSVPVLPETDDVIVMPYTEDYIQTGPGSVYARSSRHYRVDGQTHPYTWKERISYDKDYGRMPYLVERLTADDISIDFDVSQNVLQYQLTTSIGKGEPGNQCPPGFHLNAEGLYCRDVDECSRKSEHRCSHGCQNTFGSYSCSCPSGFQLVDGQDCSDVDECKHLAHDCSSSQECQNTPGGYVCVDTCSLGFTKTETGACVDIDECATRNECKFNQICTNSPGSYQCSCPRGLRSSGPNRPCIDIDECEESPGPCSHQCRNLHGGYQCICPPGQKLLADRKSCAGIQYVSRNTSRSHGSSKTSCPRGYAAGDDGQCVDIDECLRRSRCQHGCQNTPGSFHCTCPPGYKMATNKRTCIDVDECAEQRVVCGQNQRCFNKRGDFECVDVSCPPRYERDNSTGYCVLRCHQPGVDCPEGMLYKDVLEFHLVALASGIPAHRDLIRLVAYDQESVHLPQTTFTIAENGNRIPFAIRLEDGKGVVYTLQPLREKQLYRMKVEARSYDHRRRGIQYHTTFMIYISVSSYPY